MRLAFRIVAGVFGVFALGTSIPFALGSLAYGDHASALDTSWAWAALAWGIACVAVAEVSGRRRRDMVPA